MPMHPRTLSQLHSSNPANVSMPIIGYVRSPLSQKFGLPRQPNLVNIQAVIELLPPFDTPDAFVGLEQFSHVWLIWQFHHNREQASFRPQVRPPRLGGNDKIGVFATRSMYRPANLGLSVVQLTKIETINGKIRVHIMGADMVDGTPVLDIKPYVAYSDSVPSANSGFAEHQPVVKTVRLSAAFERQFYALLDASGENSLSKHDDFTNFSNNNNENLTLQDLTIIQDLIAQDPRPAYRQAEIDTLFTLRYKRFDVSFSMDKDSVLMVGSMVEIDFD